MRLDYDMVLKIMPLPGKKVKKRLPPKEVKKTPISKITVDLVFKCLPSSGKVTREWLASEAGLHSGTITRAVTALIKVNAVKRVKYNKINYIEVVGGQNA
jgi:predicted HTH transcriptional regulator